jgi:hypothetical protein
MAEVEKEGIRGRGKEEDESREGSECFVSRDELDGFTASDRIKSC